MKKIILSLLLLLPLGLFAQEMKIAFVDQNEIIFKSGMPEVSDMENAVAAKQKEYDETLRTMQDEYERKVGEFQQRGDSLTENIRKVKIQEIQELQGRLENVYNLGQDEIRKMQETLFAPIQEKVMKAISSVGEENGYSCILHPQLLLYSGKNIIDATPQVKAKLGLK